MNNKLLIIVYCISISFMNAQVGISKDLYFVPDSRTQFHVKQDNEAVRLPRVNTTTALPVSGTGTIDNGTEGSIIYNKETGSIVQNDGTQWKVSDVIVTTGKTSKSARFVRSGNTILNFGNCGNLSTLFICTGNKIASEIYLPFSNSTQNAYNEVPNAVYINTSENTIIKFNEKSLYRLSFRSGQVTENVPKYCASIGNTYYVRFDLEKRTTADISWRPIAKTTTSKMVADLTNLNSLINFGGIDTGYANAITYTDIFQKDDEIRIKFYGNLNMSTGVCTHGVGTDMTFSLNETGLNATELIVEKINF